MKKLFSIISVLMLAAMLFVAMPTQQVNAATVTVCASGCDFTTIQAAINAATPGDTITVGDGIYYEAPVIDKALTLVSVNGAASTIIHGGLVTPAIYVVSIRASNVTLSGFTVTNPLYNDPLADVTGIMVGYYGDNSLANIRITNNIVTQIGANGRTLSDTNGWPSVGIVVNGVIAGLEIDHNTIHDIHQTVTSADVTWGPTGIGFYGYDTTPLSTSVSIHDNNVYDISAINVAPAAAISNGIRAGWGSGDVTIADNTVYDIDGRGIVGASSNNGTLIIDGNSVTNCTEGVYLGNPLGGSIINNTLTGNGTAITLGSTLTTVPTISGNTLSGNTTTLTNLSSVYASVVYVDDDYTDGAAGGHIFGYDAFATIQAGITGVAAGGTVDVAAGTYPEKNLKILKSMTLMGDPGDDSAGPGLSAPVIDGGSAYGDAFLIENGVTNVTIAGFEIRNYATNEYDGVGNAVSAWEASTSNITIRDNYLHDLQYNGILVGNDGATGDHTNWLVKANIIEDFGYIGFELSNTSNSTIEDNIIHMSTPYIGAIFSSARRSESGLTIKNNLIDGTSSTTYPTIYIYAYDLEVPNPHLDSVLIEGNTITTTGTTMDIYIRNIGTGTVTGVQIIDNTLRSLRNATAEVIDASPNWWGTADKATIASHIVGSVTFEPYYIDSSMTTLSSTLPTVVYVDGTFVDGAAGGHIFGYDGFATIQGGIDGVAVGGTVNVAASAYVEDPQINKSVSLVGPNAGINPTIGVRVAEAIIYPAVSAPDPSVCEVIAYVSVDDVTIDGFTFNGDNPALTSGLLIDGADVDACELIAGYEGVGGIVIENNILKNATYSGIDLYNYNDSTATSGNYIRYNRIEDIGESTYNWGIGVLVYNNFYADITYNVFDDVRLGVQTGNFEKANPGTTGKISNNVFNVWRVGIFHNLWYSNASTIEISDNVFTAVAYPGATKWNGIILSSIGGTVNTIVQNNTIDIPSTITFPAPGYAAGYNVWNTTTTAPMTIDGGSVTGGDYGVFVNNYEGYSSNANNTAILVDGLSIDGAAIAGVYVKDSPLNTNGSTVTAGIENCVITDSGKGVWVDGADATGSAEYNQFVGNAVSGFDNGSGNLMVATSNWWGSAMGPGPVGPGDGDGVSINVGFSPWCANPECTLFGTLVDAGTDIQSLLDGANPGDIITLGPGVFPGGFSITTPNVTVLGSEGTIIEGGLPGIAIHADDVILKNFAMVCGGASTGIYLQHDSLPLNNITLQGLEVTECKTGIEVATPVTNIKLVSNWIHTNTGDGLLFQKPASVSGDTTLIAGNLFKVNGGFGIQNLNSRTVDARYNSWGATSVTAGDKVKGKVNVGNATYAEVFLDVKPVTNATMAKVSKGATFPVALRVDARALFGVEAKVAYEPEFLTYMGYTPGNFKGTGVCTVTDSNPKGELTVVCRKAYSNLDAKGVLTLVNLNFTANGADLSTGDLYETSFDVYDVMAADRNGIGVYVNNGGFNDPSAWGIRTIIDSDDGLVQISTNFSFTGYIALQGRTDNSGAVMSIFATAAPSSLIAGADGLSISDGNYWAMSPDLLLKKTYYLKADAPLYLPTTSTAATAIKHYKILGANVLPLKKVVLLGGDASNNDKVDLADATCIAATYNLDPGACGTDPNSSTDVNGDGLVNLLDLVMVGSSYNRTSSPWVP